MAWLALAASRQSDDKQVFFCFCRPFCRRRVRRRVFCHPPFRFDDGVRSRHYKSTEMRVQRSSFIRQAQAVAGGQQGSTHTCGFERTV